MMAFSTGLLFYVVSFLHCIVGAIFAHTFGIALGKEGFF